MVQCGRGNVGLGCVFSADNTATVYITENPEDGTLYFCTITGTARIPSDRYDLNDLARRLLPFTQLCTIIYDQMLRTQYH